MARRATRTATLERGRVARRLAAELRKPARELFEAWTSSRRLEASLERIHRAAMIERPEVFAGEKQEAADRIARTISDVFDAWARPLFDRFRLEYVLPLEASARRAWTLGAREGMARVGIRGSFELRNPLVLESIDNRANMLAGDVADTTFEAIKDTIRKGFYEEGKNPREVARALREEFDFLTRSRSQLIARQETLVAQSEGAFKQYRSVGVSGKEWFATGGKQGDGRTRETHREAHGQIVPLEVPFRVGEALLMFPGDPTGPLEETMGCRCDSAPVVEEETGRFWDGS